MKKLPDVVSWQELSAEIVKQFAFMKAMSEPDDRNYLILAKVDLNKVFKMAERYFSAFPNLEGVMDSKEVNLEAKIAIFLKPWISITDIVAIQQNIHYELNKLQ